MKYYIMYGRGDGALSVREFESKDDVILWLSIYMNWFRDVRVVKGSEVAVNIRVKTETTFELDGE